MKKLVLLLTIILGIGLSSSAADFYSRDISILPESAKIALAKNFKAAVGLIKTEKTLGFKTQYDVILTDGSAITFDKNGTWESIEVPTGMAVPKTFVIKGIYDYLNKNFPDQTIVGIIKQSDGYEIELSNSIEMNFDRNGNFTGYGK